jgi:hypothetical protein
MSLGSSALEIGTVIRSYQDDTYPPKVKFWIVVGISEDGVGLASVLINSNVHPFILRNPVLSDAQYLLEPDSRELVDYTCFADCSHIREKGLTEIQQLLDKKPHYVRGFLYPEEIDAVLKLIRNCPNVSQQLKNRYRFY